MSHPDVVDVNDLARLSSKMAAHHPATQAGALQAVSDDQIMEIGHRHFKPEPNLTDSAKAAFLASVRECISLSATQPNAAPAAEVVAEQDRLLAFCEGQLAKSDETVSALRHALLASNGNRGGLAEAIDGALTAFEHRERGIAQAHIAAQLVKEVRAALAAPGAAIDAREQEGGHHGA